MKRLNNNKLKEEEDIPTLLELDSETDLVSEEDAADGASEDDSDTLSIPSLNDDSDLEESDLESEESYEKGVRIFRRRDRPAIEPDYHSDSSDEETLNTVGNVPAEWYADFPHIGYDIHGQKIMKPAKGDELDAFLSAMDDPASQ